MSIMNRNLKKIIKLIIALFLLLNIPMAFHAYKFTHYYDEGEVRIKKPGEKNFWDHTKEILFGFNFVKQRNFLSDSGFETVHLTTNNNLKLEGRYNAVQNSKGTIALFHGHGGNKSGVLQEANEFINMGYSVFLLDFRAHGNSEGHTCTIGYNEAEDVKLVYDYIRNKGENNLILWGISLGAASITRCISEYDYKPEKVILELPFGSIQQAVKSRFRMMGLPPQPFAMLLTFWGGVENGFWAFNNKPSVYVKKIISPVLLQFARNDIRVTTEEREDIYNNITASKQLVIYENSGHESLCKKENVKWVTTVSSFLNH